MFTVVFLVTTGGSSLIHKVATQPRSSCSCYSTYCFKYIRTGEKSRGGENQSETVGRGSAEPSGTLRDATLAWQKGVALLGEARMQDVTLRVPRGQGARGAVLMGINN